ncbi:hypothetical protein [Parasphingorhabdus flavimaris]|uniref:hypothetical protein n=1 Tax=Parasphingorhabdus flavimaris TaxID=266812 RepID=UPI0030036B7A
MKKSGMKDDIERRRRNATWLAEWFVCTAELNADPGGTGPEISHNLPVFRWIERFAIAVC